MREGHRVRGRAVPRAGRLRARAGKGDIGLLVGATAVLCLGFALLGERIDRLQQRLDVLERAHRLELKDRAAAEWIAARPAETAAARACRLADDSVRATREGGPLCGL